MGRSQALAILDRILQRAKNKALLERKLTAALRKDPVDFFKTIVMPLLPKDSKVAAAPDGIVMWRNLLGKDVRAEDVGGGKKTSGQ